MSSDEEKTIMPTSDEEKTTTPTSDEEKTITSDEEKTKASGEADPEASEKERMAWLRKRGVFIETVEEREAAQKEDANRGTTGIADGPGDGVFEFVKIPADTREPITTQFCRRQQTSGDELPLHLKQFFSDGQGVDMSLLSQQVDKLKTSHSTLASAGANTAVSAEAMNKAVSGGSVETFPLVHPADTNDYTGIYIYLDEVGMLKRKPLNKRAADLAQRCGFEPAPSFYGDIFVGRVKTKPGMTTIDFNSTSDMDPRSAWATRAIGENLAWHQGMKQLSGGARQPSRPGEEEPAEEKGFKWSQTDEDIEIAITLATAANRKQIVVDFEPQQVTVEIAGEPLIAIPLFDGIDGDGCTWTLENGTALIITCEKANPIAWPRINDKHL